MRKAIVVLAACALTGCEPLPEEQKPTMKEPFLNGFQISIVSVFVAVDAAMLCLFLTGCEPMPEEARPTITVTEANSVKILTIKHDDHSFVVASRDTTYGVAVSIIHHPACPMEKGEE